MVMDDLWDLMVLIWVVTSKLSIGIIATGEKYSSLWSWVPILLVQKRRENFRYDKKPCEGKGMNLVVKY